MNESIEGFQNFWGRAMLWLQEIGATTAEWLATTVPALGSGVLEGQAMLYIGIGMLVLAAVITFVFQFIDLITALLGIGGALLIVAWGLLHFGILG